MKIKKAAIGMSMISAAVIVSIAVLFATSAKKQAQAIDELVASISYADGKVSFTIPTGEKVWDIRISGRMEVEGFGGMSVHHLTDESESSSWKSGKTYAFDVSDGGYAELYMSIRSDSEEVTINIMEFLPEHLQSE